MKAVFTFITLFISIVCFSQNTYNPLIKSETASLLFDRYSYNSYESVEPERIKLRLSTEKYADGLVVIMVIGAWYNGLYYTVNPHHRVYYIQPLAMAIEASKIDENEKLNKLTMLYNLFKKGYAQISFGENHFYVR